MYLKYPIAILISAPKNEADNCDSHAPGFTLWSLGGAKSKCIPYIKVAVVIYDYT
jgi:hypothetical protein